MASQGTRKILVRAPNWIGDAVMCLPALASLKKLYPKSEITVLTKGRATPVFENNPAVKEVMVYEDRGAHKGIAGKVRLSRELRERGFGLAVLFQNAFDAAFIAFTAGIPERVGYARDLRSRLLTKAIPVTEEIKKKHQVYYYLNIVKAIGGDPSGSPIPRIFLSAQEKGWAEEYLKKEGLKGKSLVGASPGASYGEAKRWMPENFASVLEGFGKGHESVSLIFGGTEDKEACDSVAGKINGRALNLAGKINLRQFMAILSRLDVFITNDSGPMHISAALGVPTIAIFGSTDPTLTGPLGKKVKVIIKNIECSPCFERECRHKHYKCLASIEPQEVYKEAERFIK